ncbi:hypothetical protein [Clostridioides difficile]|uniref:hypothetical protein n=1 Tax=Clostridioides difficile TaxID=1496 RepID=UPI000BB181D8|nr:hypothetical protein [Clostridioides difficile]PBF72396.1 hypothetical protein BGT97_13165 [Clostridioides difficile]
MWQKFKSMNGILKIIIGIIAIILLPITLVLLSIEFLVKAIGSKKKAKIALGCILVFLTTLCTRNVYNVLSIEKEEHIPVKQVSYNDKDKGKSENNIQEQQQKKEESKKLEEQKKNEEKEQNNEPTKYFTDVYLKNKNCVNMTSYEGIKSNLDIFGYKYEVIEPNETTLRQINVYDNQSNDTIQFQFYENDTGEEVVTVMQYNKKDEPDKSVAISDGFHTQPPKFQNHINNTNKEVNSIEEQINFMFN